MTAPTILLSAGEPSGDLHGAAVARALKKRWPEARLFGLGGERMAAAGVELLADPERLAVMGFMEVVGRLPFFLRLFRTVRRELSDRPVDLVLPIDYPGFNMRLARLAKRRDLPVLYYIAPQVWAWHRRRMRDLVRYTDRMAVVLPFEAPLFREAGARATFVGHPLLDGGDAPLPRSEFCRRAGLDPDRPLLALFPGSRAQELDRHLELFGAAADRVRARHDGVQPVIAASSDVPGERYADSRYPCTRDSQSLLRHARAALVKSGTTTLEAALAGVPMVIAYKTHPVSYWLAKRLVEVDHIGLVNLVAGRRLVPEFVQDAATPGALAGALAPLLERDGAERSAVVEGLETVHAALGSGVEDAEGAADGVARLAQGLLRDR